MPKVTIDGREFEAEAGQTVIQVALANGIEIPHFCWHPALSVAGNCRMCLVEIEKMPKLAIACSTQIADGMVVKTGSEMALTGREDVMEFLLINHPLDCPICDEAGQCKLQDYAFTHSSAESRFTESKNHKEKRTPLGPNVLFDAERCISCSRCIRFATEIADQPVLTFVQRGDHVTIEAYPENGLDNINSMNVIDLCPVGALTSRDFRFKARVWDMSFTDTICTGCSRNCSIRAGVRNNEVLRLEPRANPNVNDYWMCDYGRLNAYPPVNAADRIQVAKKQVNGVWSDTTWEEASQYVAERFKKFSNEEILFIGSAEVSTEDNYLFAKLARQKFGKKEIPFVKRVEGVDDRLVLRAERSPNAKGAELAGLYADGSAAPDKSQRQSLLDALKLGKIKAVYALEDDLLADEALLKAFAKVEFFACHATNTSITTSRADVVFGTSAWTERQGTMVNFAGWVQCLRPAVTTHYSVRGLDHMNMSRLDRFGSPNDRWAHGSRRDVKESWRVTEMIARHLGLHWHYLHTEDVFEEMAGAIPQFKGMDYERIGDLGLPLTGSNASTKQALYQEVYQTLTEHEESIGTPQLSEQF